MINFAFSVPIKISENTGTDSRKKTLHISGDAITEGTTRNKVKYTREELSNASGSLKGKPILDTHKQESIKNILGRVTASVFEGNKIKFDADIMDRDAIEMIEDGRIQNVSIGAKVDDLIKEEIDGSEDVMLAKGIDFLELSLCSVPGDPNATLSSALSESFKNTQEPFAGYKDMDACVAANRDKSDPKAYCATIMRKTDGESKRVDIMEGKKIKEELDTTPEPETDPVPTDSNSLDKIEAMLKQMMQMMQQAFGNKDVPEQPPADMGEEAMKQIKKLQEQLAQLKEDNVPRGKGIIGDPPATKEEIIVQGNRTEMIQENGKKFVVEKTAGGKSSFWME